MRKLYFSLWVLLSTSWSVMGLQAQPIFHNQLPVPPIADAANGVIELEMSQQLHDFNPANAADTINGITTFAYNLGSGSNLSLLGPTLRWHTGDSATIRVTNLLPQPTTTHWHGAEVPAEMDGGPHQPIRQDSSWTVTFPVLDSASTMWYHPHYHNRTVQQVQMGLSGMILLEQAGDTLAPKLPRTYGVDDIPLIMGDAGFKAGPNGLELDTLKGKRPLNVVNGVTHPYVDVPPALVRLRILNGSTRKGLSFGFSTSQAGNDPGSEVPFTLIATDGGYVLQPSTRTHMINGPGSRDEVLLDLRTYAPGDTLYLRNRYDLLPNYIVGSPNSGPYSRFPDSAGLGDATRGDAFLQLRVVDASSFPDYTPVLDDVPTWNRSWNVNLADTLGVTRHRLKRLVRQDGLFNIDSATFDMMVINDTVCLDAKEIWTIHNTTEVAHPFHIHKIQFRILDIDSAGVSIDPAARGLNGPKDDVLVLPNWRLRFMGFFENYPSEIRADRGYMYHCHILTHEDSIGGGMMQQFVVTHEPICDPSFVGVKTPGELGGMHLFPNPAKGTLHLEGEAQTPTALTFYDLSGRLVHAHRLAPFAGTAELSVAGLPRGLYMVRWQRPSGVQARLIRLD